MRMPSALVLLAVPSLVACEFVAGVEHRRAASGGDASGGSDAAQGTGGAGGNATGGQGGVAPYCGDGIINADEECDPGSGEDRFCDACQVECDEGDVEGPDGQCFHVDNADRIGWADAQERCAQWDADAHLATFTRTEEWNVVAALTSQDVWLGNRFSGGNFGWITEEALLFSPATFDAAPTVSGLCTAATGVLWENRGCDALNGALCERDPVGDRFGCPAWALADGTTGACYAKTTGVHLDWARAAGECQKFGGHLAAISSDEEASFLLPEIGYDVWLGGNDIALEGMWVWENDEPWWDDGGAKWTPGQPTVDAAKNCMELDVGLFSDRSCSATQDFVCERAPAPPPPSGR